MKLKTIIPWVVASLTVACTSAYPPRDTSTLNKISDQLKQAAIPREKAAPVPDAVSSSLLPPLRSSMPRASSKQLEQRFDLVVSDAPVNQVLMGLVHGTPFSIMVKPKNAVASMPGVTTPPVVSLMDKVTLNLKDVTLFEALDAIREVYGYDYTIDGRRIYIQQPELQTQLYQVNYIIGQRRGVSDLQVIGGASSGGGGSGSSNSGTSSGSNNQNSGSSSGSSSSYASVQASALSAISKSDLWGEVEDTLRTTLGCQIPRNIPSRSGASGGGATTSGSNSSSSASRADVSFQGDTQSGERQRGVDGCTDGRAMSINQMSGTILVRGMPNEHRVIGKMLRAMQLNIERQVIIEAKIIDVELNSGSQQGINWAAFNAANQHRFSVGANTSNISARPSTVTYPSGSTTSSTTSGTPGTTTTTTDPSGTTTTTTSGTPGTASINSVTTSGVNLAGGLVTGALGGLLGGATPIASGLGVAIQYQNFMAMINFLQTQGSVHVLSSPRIATLNNQKAVLKVGSEEPFVTNASGGQITAGTGGSPSTVSNPSITYQPFFSGIALDVTPQIDDKGNITLHVHAMVNSVSVQDKLAIISSSGPGADRFLPFAINSINETDSVVKTRDGQVVVIGGLMTERSGDGRSKVPGLGDVPGAGALFSNGTQSKSKRELVILLKPTVVTDDRAWSDDISAVQGRMEGLSAATQTKSNNQ